MAEQYSVEAILSLIDNGFTSGMENAKNQALGLTQQAKNSSNGILKMATSFGIGQMAANLATGALRVVGNTFGEITGEMNDNQKAWAMFEGNLRMIGQSEQEIAKVKASLQDFATETIYSASDMAQTYSQMAAIGVENAEKLVKGMGGLAASAENPAQAMKSLSTQMVQALSQPEMKWQDFQIMLERAPAAMAQVAEHMGYSLDDLIGAIQDGEVASKDFAAAVAEVGTNADYQGMATEFKTMDQAMDGLTETLANKLAPGFELVNEIGINAIEGVSDFVDSINFDAATDSLKGFAESFDLIDPTIETLSETIAMSEEEIQSLSNNWNELSLEDKQATVETMGQEDLESLMNLLGVEFDSIPDEYTKNAYLNAHGKDALEELLWTTGKWHDLSFEEKRLVLEAQVDNEELREVIESRDLWNNEEFYSQLAEINMNDNDAEQQILDLINQWGEMQGLEPVEMEVDVETKSAIKKITDLPKVWERYESKFSRITKSLQKTGEGIFDFMEPSFDLGKELLDTSFKHIEDNFESVTRLIEGDWSGAWDNFSSTTQSSLSDVVGSIQTYVPRMWNNIQKLGGDIGNWIDGIDWNGIYQGAASFFDGIGKQVATIDWMLVAGTVGGSIGEFASKTKGWLDENLPKTEEFVQTVLLNPDSELNIEASAFHANVDRLINELLFSAGVDKKFILDLQTEPLFSWKRWEEGINNASKKMSSDIINLINEAKSWMNSWDNPEINLEVMQEILIKEGEGWSDAEIQAWIDEKYEEGTYETQINLKPNANLEDVDLKQHFDTLKTRFGNNVVEVTQKVRALIDVYEGQGWNPKRVQDFIDREYGDGTYELMMAVEAKIEELQADESINNRELQRIINEEFGDNAYQIYMDVEPNVRLQQLVVDETLSLEEKLQEVIGNPGVSLEAHAALSMKIMPNERTSEDQIQTFIEGQFGGGHYTLEPDLSIVPRINLGAGSGGSAGSASGAGGAIESAVRAITPATPIPMDVPIAPNIEFTNANASVESGMIAIQSTVQSRTQSIQNTITAMMNGVNANFASGMSQAQGTVQSGMDGVVSALNSASDSAYSAGVNTGAGFASGISSQYDAVVGAAQSIANAASSTIQNALKIASPSKVTTWMGEMVPEGLVVGMESMIAKVKTAANKVAVAAVPNINVPSVNYSSYGGKNVSVAHSYALTDSKLDKLIRVTEEGKYINVDGYLVGQTQRGYNSENLVADSRLNERWAF